jgi:two-component system cell cycle sensor histidine kinase/response regulator CckA
MLAYAGKGRFVVERIDLSAIVEDLLPLLRVSIAKSAELHLELTRDLPGVKADATQVRQIVMNLVLNAVDALAGRNGEITVTTGVTAVDHELLARCVTGPGLPSGNYVFLEVRDTGCGMPREVMSKMFDPFFTTKFAGRGLGLAAVLGIVRGHNGALLVESEVNRGSKFRLFLPAIVGEVVRIDDPAPEPSQRWQHTGDALIIEDEEPVRVVMEALLKTFGFGAHGVADGRAGVEAFRENASRWTLVVIDLLMPGMSGEETLGALRAIKPDVRVLLVSGYTEGEIMNRVPAHGRIAFLPKPFKREAFEAKLKELFG